MCAWNALVACFSSCQDGVLSRAWFDKNQEQSDVTFYSNNQLKFYQLPGHYLVFFSKVVCFSTWNLFQLSHGLFSGSIGKFFTVSLG